MIGERIGNYVITEKLGEGGMGEVYLAAHPQIGKRVALKVLHSELSANEEITTRFFHEAKAVNDINHPNIVDILDYGSMESAKGPVVYLVMELLKGSTLTKAVAQGPLDPMRAVKIVKQVADALVASHGHRIIHRDLKPDNIMLVPRGREPEFVKLLDFGIAKVTAAGGGSMSKTRTGMVIGTPIYMSPEQCEGRGDIDHRTDVYALGTVLYELLTGAPPFTGDGYAEVLVKQLTEMPELVTAKRPGISRYLESIVMKSLAKRREDRFQTMKDMLDALSNPQEFVDAHGGVSSFAGPRSNPPPGPQLPTPLHGQPYPTPFTGQPGQPTPFTGQGTQAGYATPFTGQPTPYPMHAQPTQTHGVQGYQTSQQASVVAGVGPHQTTLSQGVGELGGRTGHGTLPPPLAEAPRSNKKLLIGALAGAAVLAGVIVVVVAGGGDKSTVVAGKESGSGSSTITGSGTEAGSAASTETAAGSGTVGSTAAGSGTAGFGTTTATTAAGAGATTAATAAGSGTTTAAGTGTAIPASGSASGTATAAGSASTGTTATVKIALTTAPVGASVFVGNEAKARCVTPCAVVVPRADSATLVVKLAGFTDEKRMISAKADLGIDLELRKRPKTTTGTPGTGSGSAVNKNPNGPVGDNTLNPFDN